MRFQQGVEERPTRLPISATERDASSCSTARILRSMASMTGLSLENERPFLRVLRSNIFPSSAKSAVFRTIYFYFKPNLFRPPVQRSGDFPRMLSTYGWQPRHFLSVNLFANS